MSDGPAVPPRLSERGARQRGTFTPSLPLETPSLPLETPSLPLETSSLPLETPSLPASTPLSTVASDGVAAEEPVPFPPIDNPERFRMLFLGLLVMLASGTVGTFAIFGFYIQVAYTHTVEEMINLFTIATSCGMAAAFPMGYLYDTCGPRVVLALSTVFLFVSLLCLGLVFDPHGYINGQRGTFVGLFFLLNVGSYGLNVAALITVISHMPRNRGMACGILTTFLGLSASFISCLFRGYLDMNFSHMFYLMTAMVAVIGVVATLFLRCAPWVDHSFFSTVRSWRQAWHAQPPPPLSPEEVKHRLEAYVRLKVPYLKYRMPPRRIRLTFLLLFVLNLYLTVQLILVAYLPITARGALNGLSTGALLLTLLTTLLIWPCEVLDGTVDYHRDEHDVHSGAVAPALHTCVLPATSPRPPETPRTSLTEMLFSPSAGERSSALGNPLEAPSSPLRQPVLGEVPEYQRIHLNYNSVMELLKYKSGLGEALLSVELWALLWMCFTVWAIGLTVTNNLFIQIFYTSVRRSTMPSTNYYLFAALSGVSIAAGRVAVGAAVEDFLPWLRERLGRPFSLPFTVLLIFPPWLSVLACIFFLSIPSPNVLLLGYVFISFAFGLMTSSIPYSVTCLFSFEHVGLGKVYGLCLGAVGLGVACFYRGLYGGVYLSHAVPMNFVVPAARGVCLAGKKDCAQTFLLVSLFLNAGAGVLALYVHWRYTVRMRRAVRLLESIASPWRPAPSSPGAPARPPPAREE